MVRKALILGQLSECKDSRKILSKVSALEGVKEAEYITGPYDFYVKVEVPDQKELSKIVESIREDEEVRETMTCLILPKMDK